MNKPISPRMHGALDYATVCVTAIAPKALEFPASATGASSVLASSYLGLSLLTDYPLAAKRVVPFKAHGAAEIATGIIIPLLPWALGFAGHRPARNFFLGLTALTFVVASLTDWE